MGGDLNGFRDIKHFYEVKGWGIAGHVTRVIQVSVIECVLPYGITLYMV